MALTSSDSWIQRENRPSGTPARRSSCCHAGPSRCCSTSVGLRRRKRYRASSSSVEDRKITAPDRIQSAMTIHPQPKPMSAGDPDDQDQAPEEPRHGRQQRRPRRRLRQSAGATSFAQAGAPPRTARRQCAQFGPGGTPPDGLGGSGWHRARPRSLRRRSDRSAHRGLSLRAPFGGWGRSWRRVSIISRGRRGRGRSGRRWRQWGRRRRRRCMGSRCRGGRTRSCRTRLRSARQSGRLS